MRKILLILFTISLNLSCVDPLDLKSDAYKKVLVVEGGITTAKGPHQIIITESAPYGSVFDGVIEPVENAIVTVRDSEGITTALNHSSQGIYLTSNEFKAEVGKSYVLVIEHNNTTYNSYQELVSPVNKLEKTYTIYAEYPYINESDNLDYKTGIDVYAKYQKVQGSSDYYIWDFEGTHIVKTYPELHETIDRSGQTIPDPLDCCETCFKTEPNDDIIISTFPLTTSEFDARLYFIEDDGYRFYDRYIMSLRRLSISKDAYNFYKLVKQQLSIDGEIFDPPPGTIGGNIININDLNESVIGYFYAADEESDTLIIEKSDLQQVNSLPIYKNDCRVILNTTTSRPSFY